jgi:hypothetical protein
MDETSFNQRLESLRNRNAKLEEELGKVLTAVDSVILAEEAPTKKALIDALIATGHRHGSCYQTFSTADFQTVRRGGSFHEMRGDKGATR